MVPGHVPMVLSAVRLHDQRMRHYTLLSAACGLWATHRPGEFGVVRPHHSSVWSPSLARFEATPKRKHVTATAPTVGAGCVPDQTTHDVFESVRNILASLAALDDDGCLGVLVDLRLPLTLGPQRLSVTLFRDDVSGRHGSTGCDFLFTNSLPPCRSRPGVGQRGSR